MTFPPSGLLLSCVPAPTGCGALQLTLTNHHERLELERQQVAEARSSQSGIILGLHFAMITPNDHQVIAGSYRPRHERLRSLATLNELGATNELRACRCAMMME